MTFRPKLHHVRLLRHADLLPHAPDGLRPLRRPTAAGEDAPVREGLRRLPLRRGDGRLEALSADHPVGSASAPASATDSAYRDEDAEERVYRRRANLGSARRRAACAHQHRRENPARDPAQRHERADPSQRRRSCRRRFTRSTPRRMPAPTRGQRLQAFESMLDPRQLCTPRTSCTCPPTPATTSSRPRTWAIVNKVFVDPRP